MWLQRRKKKNRSSVRRASTKGTTVTYRLDPVVTDESKSTSLLSRNKKKKNEFDERERKNFCSRRPLGRDNTNEWRRRKRRK
jgi:hypothetical protein